MQSNKISIWYQNNKVGQVHSKPNQTTSRWAPLEVDGRGIIGLVKDILRAKAHKMFLLWDNMIIIGEVANILFKTLIFPNY